MCSSIECMRSGRGWFYLIGSIIALFHSCWNHVVQDVERRKYENYGPADRARNHDETTTKPLRNHSYFIGETTKPPHFKNKVYYMYIIFYRIWWFRRLIDKNRVVSSRFRCGFVVVACAICGPVISVLSRFGILQNMTPARIS